MVNQIKMHRVSLPFKSVVLNDIFFDKNVKKKVFEGDLLVRFQ